MEFDISLEEKEMLIKLLEGATMPLSHAQQGLDLLKKLQEAKE